MARALLLIPITLLLSGCMTLSRSAAVAPIPADWSRDGRVTEIVLSRAPGLKVTPQFDTVFKSHVQARLDTCATGSKPLRLEASIERFEKANPLLTAVVAGANVLRGTARLVDVASGRTVGTTVSAPPSSAAASRWW